MLLGMEGFEIDQNATLLAAKHGACSSFAAITGRLGWGAALSVGAGTFSKYFAAQHTTLIVGAAVNFKDIDATQIFTFLHAGVQQITVQYSGDAIRTIRVRRGNYSGAILAESTWLVTPNAWYYVEFKCTFADGTGGSFELRINGTPIITATGLDTLNTTGYEPSRVDLDLQNAYDDIYWADNTGAQWNDFQGELAIEGILPNADGTNGDFTPQGAGANYVEVDDPAGNTDGDTTYNSSSTAGHKDSFTHPALAHSGTILAVAAGAWARKDDAGSRTARALLLSGATTQTGDTLIVSDSWTWLETLAELDPNTAAAWSEAAVNATEFGYELVS